MEQINLLLTHLPVDITLVDENDNVDTIQGQERIFVRTPSIIGRKVQNCHPPHRCISSIASWMRCAPGLAIWRVWIQMAGKFVTFAILLCTTKQANIVV